MHRTLIGTVADAGVEDAEEDDDLNAELEGDEELDETLAGEDDAGDEEDDGKEEPADDES